MGEIIRSIDEFAEEKESELEEEVEESLNTEDKSAEEDKEREAYHDPLSEEYKRDMHNWLGINMRKRRDEL